jgi:uncharacterized protein (DUF1330 family)
MSAYVIAEVNVTDPDQFAEYRKLVPPTIEKYGGRFVVRGGTVETKEGGWAPARMVVIEFPSMDQARKWYHSPEYAPALAMRLKCANAKLILAEGV